MEEEEVGELLTKNPFQPKIEILQVALTSVRLWTCRNIRLGIIERTQTLQCRHNTDRFFKSFLCQSEIRWQQCRTGTLQRLLVHYFAPCSVCSFIRRSRAVGC